MNITVNDKREIVITCDIPCAERLAVLLSALGDEATDLMHADAGNIADWLRNTIEFVKGGLVAPGELGSSTPPTLPRMTVDSETGAIYVYVSDQPVEHTVSNDTLDPTRHIYGMVNIDLAFDSSIVGVEILPI